MRMVPALDRGLRILQLLAARDARMKAHAQADVDAFYARMAEAI